MVSAKPLQDRYRLQDRLAYGGMGAVYAGIDERLERRVAIKVLKEEFAADPRFVERFRREARAVAALSHTNIASIFDYGRDGFEFIIMELVEGRDLSRLLQSEGALGPERAAAIGAQIADALAHAHTAGVIHRDIKPANVIVQSDDRVKVTDFGIARAIGDSTLTETGSVLGTAHYLSPEQADGRGAGPHSDVYSAGIVLYEMLAGTVPFTGESAVAVAMAHISGDVPPPGSVKPGVPPQLDAIVARATAKDPARRLSAREMADALRTTTPTAPAATLAAPGPQRTQRLPAKPVSPAGRAPVGKSMMLALLALAAAGLLYFVFRPAPETTRNPPERAGGQAGSTQQETPSEAPASYTVEEGLVGMRKHDAREYLEDLGLGLHVLEEKVPSEVFDKDTVIDVEPGVGTTVSEGDAITLFVSEPPKDEKSPPGQEKKDEEEDD